MKTLSTYNQAVIDNPHVDVVRLIQIDFSGLSLYVCSRIWGVVGSECTFNSQLYEPVVLSCDVSLGDIDPVSYQAAPSEARILIDNNTPIGGANRFTALFADYDPHYATVTISDIFVGASAAEDQIDIFKGRVEDIMDMTAEQITLVCSGDELYIANKFLFDVVDDDTYPDADPDEYGKMLPLAWGGCKKVPFRAIDVGAISSLVGDITASATTIELSDASRLDSSGTVLIDTEKIAYTGISADSLTGCTRGALSTTAAKHNAGALVGEIKDAYVYAIGNAVQQVGDVYVNKIRQDPAIYTAYTGQTGDEHATYAGKAVIAFNQWPQIQRKVDLTVSEAVYDVDREATNTPLGYIQALDIQGDIVGFDDATTITFPSAPSGNLSNIYVEYTFEFLHVGTLSEHYEFSIDGNMVGSWRDASFTQWITSPLVVKKSTWPTSAEKTATYRGENGNGTALIITSAKVYATSDEDDVATRGKLVAFQALNVPVGQFFSEVSGEVSSEIVFPGTPPGNLSSIRTTYSWACNVWGSGVPSVAPLHFEIGSGEHAVAVMNDDSSITNLRGQTVWFQHDAWQTSVEKTPSRLDEFARGYSFVISNAEQSCYTDDYTAALALTGNSMADAVIGGEVTADVDGYQDDGDGTYTGTPDALIERPDHIFKHILINRCGLSADDIDATSYAESGTHYQANSMILAAAILEKPNIREVLDELAYQCRSIGFWEAGIHKLIYLIDEENASKTIEADRIDAGSLHVEYTKRVDILNSLTGKYDYEWCGNDDAYQDIVSATCEGSITKYGTLEGSPKLFSSVSRDSHATAILHWIRDTLDYPRLAVEFSGGHYLADLERGDVIDFTFEDGDILDKSLMELVESETSQFMVMGMVRKGTAISVLAIAVESRPAGVAAIIQVSVTSAANAGTIDVASVMTQPCIIEEVAVRADDAQTEDLTSIACYCGPSNVNTIFTSKARAYFDAADKQVSWSGGIFLMPADKVQLLLTGTGSTAVDLTVTILYRPAYSGGYME